MRWGGRLAAALLLSLPLLAWQLQAAVAAAGRERAARPPSFVLIQADDMTLQQLRATYRAPGGPRLAMPNALRLAGQGVELTRYYASDPICGPSRASLLTGRTARNHGMLINAEPYGYPGWAATRYFRRNLAHWLQRAGYRTVHVGKYMNGYGISDPAQVPAGWSRWLTTLPSAGASYYGYQLNVDGQLSPPIGAWSLRDPAQCAVAPPGTPGGCLHATDVQTALAVAEVEASAADRRPLFLQVDYNAPHDDGRAGHGPEPPTRHRPLAGRARQGFPRGIAAYDEPDVRDKPRFIRGQAPLTPELAEEAGERYGKEVASLAAVDEGIARILGALRRTGRLPRTYVLFTSDNGMFHGEHRVAYGKYLPHEPSSHVPLLVRGPGIPAGRRSAALATNLDLAPTLLELAGTRAGVPLDGKSLAPFLRDPSLRSAAPAPLAGFNGHPELPEQFLDGLGGHAPNQALVLDWTGFVAGPWKYVRYRYGDEELYDLSQDPAEEQSLVRRRSLADVLGWARQLDRRLAKCSGARCTRPVTPPPAPVPAVAGALEARGQKGSAGPGAS